MKRPPLRKDLHEDNRLAWNAATRAHQSHRGDQASFFRQGGSTLFPEERRLLGEVTGLAVAHLLCNAGQDTLGLAQLGADVTGVDISDEAITAARQLAGETGLRATFVRSDVYDWLDETAASPVRFDVAFCSYGAWMWLSDVERFARGVAQVLRPGGRLVTVDFHPFALLFDRTGKRDRDYFARGVPSTSDSGIGDYVARARDALVPWGYVEGVQGFRNPHRGHEFSWGLGELLGAILHAGLLLEAFEEYPFSNGEPVLDGMLRVEGRRFVTPPGAHDLPYMFGLSARSPGPREP